MENAKLVLPGPARLFVLLQRTELIPRPLKLLREVNRLASKSGLDPNVYIGGLRVYSRFRGRRIEMQYALLMAQLASRLRPYVPEQVSTLLDIDSGIGALHVYLDRVASSSRNYVLLDNTRISSSIWYGMESESAFCNSLDLARDVLAANGIDEQRIATISATPDSRIELNSGSVDCVVSSIAWGFHFPIETYLDEVLRVIRRNGVLLIDVRNGTDGRAKLEEHFQMREIYVAEKFTSYVCWKC